MLRLLLVLCIFLKFQASLIKIGADGLHVSHLQGTSAGWVYPLVIVAPKLSNMCLGNDLSTMVVKGFKYVQDLFSDDPCFAPVKEHCRYNH